MKTNNYISEEADDTVQRYYSHVGEFPLLKRSEEIKLFETMQKWSKNMSKAGQRTRINGKAAREKIIKDLSICLRTDGYKNIKEAVGTDV